MLLINPENVVRPNEPYPRRYYRGVASRATATVVNIGSGEQISGAVFRLDRLRYVRRITVRLYWSSGRSIDNPALIRAVVCGQINAGGTPATPVRSEEVYLSPGPAATTVTLTTVTLTILAIGCPDVPQP